MASDVVLEYGHPYVDTLARVRRRLGILEQDETAFVAQVANVPDPRPNMERILAINRHGIRVAPEEATTPEEGPNRCGVKTLPA